jgi:hypothetical protein
VDETKLARLIYEQRPVPAQAFDERITRQVNRLVRETQPMKKKMSALAVCVIIILSLALCGAVAEMLGLNLFELFGQRDNRFMELAPKAVLNEESPVTVTSPDLGKAVAGINSAYYDGQSLLVAYSIQNGNRAEKFVPSKEMLAKMSLVDPQLGIMAESDDEALLMKEWIAAKESGTAIGIVRYFVSPSDHTVTDDGIDLPPSTENQMEGEGNTVHYIREYENPLPEEARDREHLNISFRLYQGASYLYFDGQNTYACSENMELAPMQATIWRADAEVRRFKGGGKYNGNPVSIEVSVSAATARVMATMDDAVFPALPEDTWYDLILLDENGTEYRAREGSDGNVKQMNVSFDGTGKLPENLTLRILLVTEGEWDKEAAIANATLFELERMASE